MRLSLPLALCLATNLFAGDAVNVHILYINGTPNYINLDNPAASVIDYPRFNYVFPAPRTDSPIYQPYGYSPYYSHKQIGGPPPVHYHSYGYYHPHNVTAIKITVKK